MHTGKHTKGPNTHTMHQSTARWCRCRPTWKVLRANDKYCSWSSALYWGTSIHCQGHTQIVANNRGAQWETSSSRSIKGATCKGTRTQPITAADGHLDAAPKPLLPVIRQARMTPDTPATRSRPATPTDKWLSDTSKCCKFVSSLYWACNDPCKQQQQQQQTRSKTGAGFRHGVH